MLTISKNWRATPVRETLLASVTITNPHRRSPQIRSENTYHQIMVLPFHPHLTQPPNLIPLFLSLLARDHPSNPHTRPTHIPVQPTYPSNPHTLPLRPDTARHHHSRLNFSFEYRGQRANHFEFRCRRWDSSSGVSRLFDNFGVPYPGSSS